MNDGENRMKHPKKMFESMDYLSQLRKAASEIDYFVNFLEHHELASWLHGKQDKEDVIIISIKKSKFDWSKDSGLHMKPIEKK